MVNGCKHQQTHHHRCVPSEDLDQATHSRFLIKTLRKHTYSNILKILQPKKENFQIKNSDILHIPAQNIDCRYPLEPPRRGGSNEYSQSMFFKQN